MNQCFQYCSIIPGIVVSGSSNKKGWQQQFVGNVLEWYIECFRIPTGFAMPVCIFWGSEYKAVLICKLSQTGLRKH